MDKSVNNARGLGNVIPASQVILVLVKHIARKDLTSGLILLSLILFLCNSESNEKLIKLFRVRMKLCEACNSTTPYRGAADHTAYYSALLPSTPGHRPGGTRGRGVEGASAQMAHL